MKLPLYQGETVQPARIPQGSAPAENPFASTWQRSAAVLTDTALNFEQAIRDRQEYILEQNRSAALNSAINNMNTEMIQRLRIGDGRKGSFYDKNGLLIQEEVDELKERYLSIADAWTSGFSSEQGMLAASKAQQQYREAVPSAIDSKLMAGLKSRAAQALNNNISASISRADFEAAHFANDDAYNRGMTSKAEHDNTYNDIESKRFEYETDIFDSAEEIKDNINNPLNQEVLANNPKLRNYALRKMDTLLRTKARAARDTYTAKLDEALAETEQQILAIEQEKLEYEANPETQTTTKHVARLGEMKPNARFKDTLPAPPTAASTHVRMFFHKYKGDFSSPTSQHEAMSVLIQECSVVKDFNDPVNAKHIEILANTLGLSKSDANTAIEYYQNSLKQSNTTFNPSKVSADILKLSKSRIAHNEQTIKSILPDLGIDMPFDKDTASVAYSLNKATHEFYTWHMQNPDATLDAQVNQFNAYYHNNLKAQQVANIELLNSDAFTVYNQYKVSGGENRINADVADKEYAQALEKIEAAYAKEIDDRIEKIGVDDALAEFPIQAAAMHSTLQAALDRQKNNSFSVSSHIPGNPYVLPGYADEYILYLPASQKDTFPHKYLVAKAGDDQYTPIRVVYVEGIKDAIPSELLQQRALVFGKDFNRINFTNNILSFSEDTTKTQSFEQANPDKAQQKKSLELQKRSLQTAKRTSRSTNDEETIEEAQPIQGEASLLPDDGLVPEEHYMPTGKLPFR